MSSAIIIILTIIFSAFFSGMEIAFISANKLRIELSRKQKKIGSGIISVFTNNPGQYIATMLVGNNIALVIYGIEIAKALEPFITQFTGSDSLTLFFQTLISTLLILLTAEFLPKTLFRLNPNGVLGVFAIPLIFFYIILYPITFFTIKISNLILIRVFKDPDILKQEQNVFTKVDLNNLVKEVDIEKVHKEEIGHDLQIFKNALDFSEVKLRECMIPRNEIVAMEITSTIDDLTKRFIETGFSKILIYKETIDNIIGYFNAKDLFKDPKSIKSKMRDLIIVPETMSANILLEQFNKETKNIALIVDEFGGTAGLVTIEDIIEEIIGEIEDEHDTDDFVDTKVSDNIFVLSGRLEIDYVNEKYNLSLPVSEEYETIAGLIIHHFEDIPEKDEKILIRKFSFTILESTSTKIELVKLVIS